MRLRIRLRLFSPILRPWIRRSVWAALLVVLLSPRAEAAVRHVVLLQSLERGSLVLDRFAAMLRLQLDEHSADPITFIEFVVNPSGVSETPEQAMVDFLRSAFAGRPTPDLIITAGGPAAAFARRHRAHLFVDSPILYAAVDRRFLSGGGDFSERETTVPVANDPTLSIDAILQVFPATENVFVIVGAGTLGRFWRSEFERESSRFRDRVRFIWTDGMSYAAMLQRAATLPPRSAIFFNSFDVDADGATYSTERVLADLRARGNAPVFGAQSAELGHGLIGGKLISIDDVSRTTAEVALRILGGTPPALIKTAIQHPGPLTFDWRELQRWSVSEDRLPPGSLIQFREPGVWDRFWWVIVGSLSAFVAQSLLIGALLVTRAKRRRVEQSLRESEGRFRLLANSAPVMIRISDPDTHATDFNVPWLAFTGRDLDAERGHGWLEGVHPDDVAACVETRRRAFQRGEPYRMEYRLRRADGEYRWLLDSGQPRLTQEGVLIGFIGSATDITDLKTARATLSSLNRRLMEAQEQERSRVARELHDDVCQQMTMLALELDRLGKSLPESAGDVRQQTLHLYQEVKALGAHVNGISHRLHSSKLGLLGLAAAIESFCKDISSLHGVTVEFVRQDVPATLSEDVAINLFRVLQEALSNAARHSGASRCRVSLSATDDQLQLEVSDEGRGFETDLALTTSGLGLVSMQERLKLVNGTVAIESKPGAGTTVRAAVPLRPAAVSGVTPVGSGRMTA